MGFFKNLITIIVCGFDGRLIGYPVCTLGSVLETTFDGYWIFDHNGKVSKFAGQRGHGFVIGL